MIGGAIAAAVLLLLLGCLAAGAAVRGGIRLADRAEENDRAEDRLAVACLELETRLNRLVPPGTTGGDPRRRADAVRDENTAARPLLVELETMTTDEEHRADRDRAEWASAWRQLIEARTSYADALERQASAGEPAFFIAPRLPDGDDVVEELQESGPDSCEGAIRRLGHPDL